MLGERGVDVDHTTIYRWVQRYAPLIQEKLKGYWRPRSGGSWKVDETYIKVKCKWVYLYRALDKRGQTIDFFLSTTRNAKAAQRFLTRALRGLKTWEYPDTINTDKAPAYGVAIKALKASGKCPEWVHHRQVKYLNNAIESDHGKLKRLIYPVRGFKSMKTAYSTLKGFEVMYMFKKGQFELWQYGRGTAGETCLITNALMKG
jgi:transposase, IS6 family